MKQIYRVTALAVFATFLAAGCATTDTKPKEKAGSIDGIQYKVKATDAEKADKALSNKIAAAFKADARMKGAYIFATPTNGDVKLVGSGTAAQSALAEKIAKTVDGVKSVTNKVKTMK
jgi:osmotically-inducible protein OsmY